MREKCLYSEFSGPHFPESLSISQYFFSISLYSVGMWENPDQNNFEYRHFLCSGGCKSIDLYLVDFVLLF